MPAPGFPFFVYDSDAVKGGDVPVFASLPNFEPPAEARKRNLLLDPAELRAGDLMLFRPKKTSLIAAAISQVQLKLRHEPEDASWTHAAIYLGGDQVICEAVPADGVRIGNLYNRVFSHHFRVRRDTSLTDAEAWRIAERALVYLWRPYSFARIRQFSRKLLSEAELPAQRHGSLDRALICSELYDRAYMLATSKTLVSHAREAVTPAMLSATPKLIDQELQWRRLR